MHMGGVTVLALSLKVASNLQSIECYEINGPVYSIFGDVEKDHLTRNIGVFMQRDHTTL